MDILKKIFPLSFKYVGSVSNLVIGVLVQIVAAILFGVVIGIVGLIPIAIISWLLRIVSSLIDLYLVAGIVIQFLVHFKVLKD